MPTFNEDEMMRDLAAADAAGDTQLATHIAGKIKAARVAPMDVSPTGSDFENFAAGMGGRAMDLYRGTKQLFNIGDQQKLQAEIDEAKRLDAPLKDTKAGMAGGVLTDAASFILPGGLVAKGVGMLPRAAQAGKLAKGAMVLGEGAATGGAQSAFEPIAGDETQLSASLFGIGGGAAGNLAARGLGRVITPFRSTDSARSRMVKTLLDEDIPISAGQATGSKTLQAIEGGLASNPLTKSFLVAGGEDQQKAYTRALARRLGADVDQLTPEVMDEISTGLGRQFEKVAGAAPQPRSQLYGEELDALLGKAIQEQSDLGAKTAPGQELLEAAMDRNYNVPEVTGEAYNRIRSGLTKEASRLARSGDTGAAETARALRELEDKEAQRLFGEAAGLPPTWRAWGQFKNLESPGALSPEGLVNPYRLSTAVRGKNPSAFASGTGDDYVDLIRASSLLKPAHEGSTTARNLTVASLLLGGGGLGYSAYDDPLRTATGTAGTLTALGLSQTKAGRRYMSNALMNTERGRLIADFLRHRATSAGAGLAENKQ